jgi:hypothetical protein
MKALAWLALAGAAVAAYGRRASIATELQALKNGALDAYASAADPAALAGHPLGAPPRTEAGKAVAALLARRGVQAPAAAPGAPAPAAPVRAERAPLPPEPLKWERCVYGVVSDLATGLAVAGAEVRVRSSGAPSPLETKTDDRGRFVVNVDESFLAVGETSLEVAAPGYAFAGEDEDPPSFEKTKGERAAQLARLRARERVPIPVVFAPSGEFLAVNVVVAAAAPSSTTAPPPRRPRAVRPPPPEAPDAEHRRAYGVVFDLGTAAVIPAALLTFRRSAGTPLSARADERGVYQIDLPRRDLDAGVAVEVSAPGYRDGQVEDGSPSYLERTPAQRLEAQSELADHDFDPVSVPDGEEPVVLLDIALVREARK